jgi:hypothetical protein
LQQLQKSAKRKELIKQRRAYAHSLRPRLLKFTKTGAGLPPKPIVPAELKIEIDNGRDVQSALQLSSPSLSTSTAETSEGEPRL